MDAIQGVGDHEAEDGVAEELQPLVRRQTARLVRERAVRQRPFEQTPLDRAADPILERVVRRRWGTVGTCRHLGPTVTSDPRPPLSPPCYGRQTARTWRLLYVPQVGQAVCCNFG